MTERKSSPVGRLGKWMNRRRALGSIPYSTALRTHLVIAGSVTEWRVVLGQALYAMTIVRGSAMKWLIRSAAFPKTLRLAAQRTREAPQIHSRSLDMISSGDGDDGRPALERVRCVASSSRIGYA